MRVPREKLHSYPYPSKSQPRPLSETEMSTCRSRFIALIIVGLFGYALWTVANSKTFHRIFHPTPEPRSPPLLLIWDRQTHFLETKPYRERKDIPKHQLYDCFCEITSDPAAWRLADAVMIDAAYLERVRNFERLFPPRRTRSQLWALYATDPSPFASSRLINQTFLPKLDNQFNLTVAYRSDSDVAISRGRLRAFYADETPPVPLKDYASGKTHLAAVFLSNCHAKSGRLEFIKELQKYIPVDVFGDCGPQKCPNATVANCDAMLSSSYKFYLSFEALICKDYITERFLRPMEINIVPVALSGADYSAINAPNGSYIDARSFTTVKKLADHLLYLDRNHSAYNEYFRWKSKLKVERKGKYSEHLCQLCNKLNEIVFEDAEPFYQTYPDISIWLTEKAECSEASVLNGIWTRTNN